jgi:hypothetical protein
MECSMPPTDQAVDPLRPESRPRLIDLWFAWLGRAKGPSRIRTGLWIVFMALVALVVMFWIAVNAFAYSEGKPDPQSVVAVMGVVVSPVVSVVASYFGITMASSRNGRSGNGTNDDQ